MWNCRRLLTGWIALVLSLGMTAARADEQVVTLKYVGTDVRKAIGLLQTVSDLRVVVDPRVPSKRITLSLKDVPAEDALRTVVASAGLTCRKVGNAFLVEPKHASRPEADALKAASPRDRAPELQLTQPAGQAGIVRPDAPGANGPVARAGERETAVDVAPAVLEALERSVDVDVKNGPLSAVTEQLGRASAIKVTADPALSSDLVVTVSCHGIPLKAALELVAGQTGLQISPRPEGVAFVRPGFSLDAAQARSRRAPAGAQHVDQGQLWTAEWGKVLTSGISGAEELPAHRSLRRQPLTPGASPFEFKPRSGTLRQALPAASAAPDGRQAPAPPARRGAGAGFGATTAAPVREAKDKNVPHLRSNARSARTAKARKGKAPGKVTAKVGG